MTAGTGIPGLGGDPVDLEAAPSIAQRVAALNAVRSVNEAMEKYNPATLAALHWGERAVQEIARLSAEVERLQDLVEAESRERFREGVELRTEIDRLRPVVEAAQAWRAEHARWERDNPYHGESSADVVALISAVDAYEARGEVR